MVNRPKLSLVLLVTFMFLVCSSMLAQQKTPSSPSQTTPDVHEAYVAAINSNDLEDTSRFERYSYKSTDTPRGGGDAIMDTGWGLLIYHRDKDGKWRVARDAWGSDRPAK